MCIGNFNIKETQAIDLRVGKERVDGRDRENNIIVFK